MQVVPGPTAEDPWELVLLAGQVTARTRIKGQVVDGATWTAMLDGTHSVSHTVPSSGSRNPQSIAEALRDDLNALPNADFADLGFSASTEVFWDAPTGSYPGRRGGTG